MRAVNLLKLCVGVVAALMLSIAMSASASAAEFLASKFERLLAEKVSTQIFTTKAGTIECSTVNILAGTTVLKSTEQLVLVDYENCKAFVFFNVQISPAHYLFLANGIVHILKLIKIFVPDNSCEISVPAQATNGVDYKTNGSKLLILPLVNSIKYTQSNNCNTAGTFNDGTYRGHLEVMIPNGTVSFDP